jgi:hypothetical protein
LRRGSSGSAGFIWPPSVFGQVGQVGHLVRLQVSFIRKVRVLFKHSFPACSRTELRRREAGWGVPGGEGPVRNASELDSAVCLGEPARYWRSPDHVRCGCRQRVVGKRLAWKPVTLNGSVSKRWRGAWGGWRRNGRKVELVKQRDLPESGQQPAGVRGAIVVSKPGNAGGAKGSREIDVE